MMTLHPTPPETPHPPTNDDDGGGDGPIPMLLGLDLRPLLTPAGAAYDERDLPCYWLPHLWDEDATPAENEHAANLCITECPARAACSTRRHQLDGAAEGVWAGEIIPTTDTGPTYHDLHVAALNTELGLTETAHLN